MPTYEYECSNCAATHEVVQKMSDPTLTECPVCGHSPIRKLFTGVGVVFKGSGFYRTDSRGSGEGGSSSTATSSSTADSTKSDSGSSGSSASDSGKTAAKKSDSAASSAPKPAASSSTSSATP